MLIHDAARRLARAAWLERRAFEVLGAWSASCDDVDAVRLLAVESRHHAWRASLLEEQVPLLHDVDPAELAPSAALVAFVDAFAAPAGTLERLTGLVRVLLPQLLAEHEELLALASPVADAPVLRVLRLVVADEQEDWRAAEELLRSMVRSERDEVGSAAHQSHLEGLLLLAR